MCIRDRLKGEKIDIFEWSDNISELIKNALAPAQILAVLPTEDKRSLLVVCLLYTSSFPFLSG